MRKTKNSFLKNKAEYNILFCYLMARKCMHLGVKRVPLIFVFGWMLSALSCNNCNKLNQMLPNKFKLTFLQNHWMEFSLHNLLFGFWSFPIHQCKLTGERLEWREKLKALLCDDKARKDKGPLFNILIPTWKVTNE